MLSNDLIKTLLSMRYVFFGVSSLSKKSLPINLSLPRRPFLCVMMISFNSSRVLGGLAGVDVPDRQTACCGQAATHNPKPIHRFGSTRAGRLCRPVWHRPGTGAHTGRRLCTPADLPRLCGSWPKSREASAASDALRV